MLLLLHGQRRKLLQRFSDDVQRVLDLLLSDDQWRGQSNDILMGRFSLQIFVSELTGNFFHVCNFQGSSYQ